MSDIWTIKYEDEIEGVELKIGSSFALLGEIGKRYNYIRTVTNEDGEVWVDCFGGSSTNHKQRSVHHDQIKPETIKAKRIPAPRIPPPVKPKKRTRR